MSVIETYKEEVGISKCLKWSNINPSSYYYIPKDRQAGRKPSTITLKTDGSIALEEQVIEEIKKYYLSNTYVMATNPLQQNCLTKAT